MTVEERFWTKVDQSGGCWLWTAGKTGDGYGNFKVNHRTLLAHRFAYELLVGPIPQGLQLDHLCRSRSCVNPAHLEPVTVGENIRRGETGRANRDKTRCPRDHPYDDTNTWKGPKGGRQCRTCHRERERERRRKLLPAAA